MELQRQQGVTISRIKGEDIVVGDTNDKQALFVSMLDSLPIVINSGNRQQYILIGIFGTHIFEALHL